MNLVLVSRSMDKLKKVEDKVKSINSAIKTRIVVADFSKSDDIEMFKRIE